MITEQNTKKEYNNNLVFNVWIVFQAIHPKLRTSVQNNWVLYYSSNKHTLMVIHL